MKFKEYFKEIDESILKKSPFHWVIGWHIFIPVILVLALFGKGLSFIYPVRLYYSNLGKISFISYFFYFLCFIVFILFIIRQIRYNSSRIHHRLPFIRSNSNYFSYVVIIFMLSVIPLIPFEFYTFRVNQDINSRTDNFEKDIRILDAGIKFFYNEEVVWYPGYGFGGLHRDFYRSYVSDIPDLELIESFMDVSRRFGIKLSETDPKVIYSRSFDSEPKFYSYLIANSEISSSIDKHKESHYDVYTYYDSLIRNYNFNREYALNREGSLYSLIYFAIGFAFLLWIFVSVPAVEFGLSVLWAVLISILVGILIGVSYAMDNSDGFARGIFYFAVIIIFILAFLRKKESRFTSIMKILSQLLIPGLFLMLFWEYDYLLHDSHSYDIDL